MIYILLLINILLLVSGQTLWKMGLTGIELKFSLQDIVKLFFNPYIFVGLIIYGAATVIWLYILSRAELSLVYPLQSLCYVTAAVAAVLIFKENIPLTRWGGLGLIVLGAYFVSIK
jgi:drug/metabolite transporter (DMT)-like permease